MFSVRRFLQLLAFPIGAFLIFLAACGDGEHQVNQSRMKYKASGDFANYCIVDMAFTWSDESDPKDREQYYRRIVLSLNEIFLGFTPWQADLAGFDFAVFGVDAPCQSGVLPARQDVTRSIMEIGRAYELDAVLKETKIDYTAGNESGRLLDYFALSRQRKKIRLSATKHIHRELFRLEQPHYDIYDCLVYLQDGLKFLQKYDPYLQEFSQRMVKYGPSIRDITTTPKSQAVVFVMADQCEDRQAIVARTIRWTALLMNIELPNKNFKMQINDLHDIYPWRQ